MGRSKKPTQDFRLVLPQDVRDAILCGPDFAYRDWRKVRAAGGTLTPAEMAMAFSEAHHPLPDGAKVGQYVRLLPFQEAAFYQIIDTSAWMTILSMGRKNAKALSLDTPIPTPEGFRPLRDIHPGDIVFSGDGYQTRVIAESEVFTDKRCYAVMFSTGLCIVASADHRWRTTHKGISGRCISVVTTEDIAGSLLTETASGAWEPNHVIDCPPLAWHPGFSRFLRDGGMSPMEFTARREIKITAIGEIEPMPCKCITVGNPGHLFLAGYDCIPTHNSETVARILAPYLIGPLAEQNSNIALAANSRDQAAHIYDYLYKALSQNRRLDGLYRIIPYQKSIVGIRRNVTLKCLSAEAKNAHGGQYKIIVFDELGQITAQTSEFFDSLVTGQGTQADPKFIVLSTQARNDDCLLSLLIDTAIRVDSKTTAVHLYTAAPSCNLDDRAQWKKANPALGDFRTVADIERQCEAAMATPSSENRFRNLVLNQRVSFESVFLAPGPYRDCNGAPDMSAFHSYPVAIALDLSQRQDLTAACLAACDESGIVHLYPFVFCPASGIEERSAKDHAPYDAWVKSGHMIPIGGKTMDYTQIALYLRDELARLDIAPRWVAYDRWGIAQFKKAALDVGFMPYAEWLSVGQGFKDFSPRCKAFESLILAGRIRHGGHPLFNMAFSNAVVVSDPAGNIKLDKMKSNMRIDPAIAAIMAAFQVTEGQTPSYDVSTMIG